MSPRLIRAVLAVYPRRVRERYGEELSDMLAGSPHPLRDLADVARCALADRLTEPIRSRPTMSSIRQPVLTLVKLVIAPLAFGIGMLMLTMVTGPLGNLIPLPEHAHMAAYSLAVAPVALVALWLGRSMARTERISYPVVVAPVAMTLGIIGFARIPDPGPGQALGERFTGTVAATVVWCIGLIVLMTAARALSGSRARVWTVGLLGGFVLLELACIAYMLAAVTPDEAPRHYALWWYPSMISGVDPGLVMGSPYMLQDLMKGLPAVLTVSTFFALSLAVASARRDAAAAVRSDKVSQAVS